MAVLEVNSTRMELNRLKHKLAIARKGHRLLKSKCDGLVRKLTDLNKMVFKMEKEVYGAIEKVFLNFELSKAEVFDEKINFLVDSFKEAELLVKINKQNFMGVKLPVLEALNLNEFKDFNFLFFQESSFFDESCSKIVEIFPKLLNFVNLKYSIKFLNCEINKVRRKVNALEFLIIPNYFETIKSIELKLEENERNNVARLSRVK